METYFIDKIFVDEKKWIILFFIDNSYKNLKFGCRLFFIDKCQLIVIDNDRLHKYSRLSTLSVLTDFELQTRKKIITNGNILFKNCVDNYCYDIVKFVEIIYFIVITIFKISINFNLFKYESPWSQSAKVDGLKIWNNGSRQSGSTIVGGPDSWKWTVKRCRSGRSEIF